MIGKKWSLLLLLVMTLMAGSCVDTSGQTASAPVTQQSEGCSGDQGFEHPVRSRETPYPEPNWLTTATWTGDRSRTISVAMEAPWALSWEGDAALSVTFSGGRSDADPRTFILDRRLYGGIRDYIPGSYAYDLTVNASGPWSMILERPCPF